MNPDKYDPFRIDAAAHRMPKKSNGIVPNYKAIPLPELHLCQVLGKRASDLIAHHANTHPERQIVTPHPLVCSADFATVHLHRPLRLQALHEADDLAFMGDYLLIARHLDREHCRWDRSIPLNFYDHRLRDAWNWLTITPRIPQ